KFDEQQLLRPILAADLFPAAQTDDVRIDRRVFLGGCPDQRRNALARIIRSSEWRQGSIGSSRWQGRRPGQRRQGGGRFIERGNLWRGGRRRGLGGSRPGIRACQDDGWGGVWERLALRSLTPGPSPRRGERRPSQPLFLDRRGETVPRPLSAE